MVQLQFVCLYRELIPTLYIKRGHLNFSRMFFSIFLLDKANFPHKENTVTLFVLFNTLMLHNMTTETTNA
jgi:hypothetical protein